MSYQESQHVFGILNHGLQERYEHDQAITIDVVGKPNFHILSFTPLSYEEYGRFRNKAPRVVGSVVLRSLLTQHHPSGGAIVVAGVESGSEGYGFYLSSGDPNSYKLLTDVAKDLGNFNLELWPE